MRKVEILSKAVDIESILARTDIKILSIDIKSVEQSFYYQEGICAVVCYEDDLSVVESEPDWHQIKIQASIAAMQGMITGSHSNSSSCATIRGLAKREKLLISDVISKMAIEYADALVKELKKQTK